MREENYAAAAQAQREVALLTERLPPSKALLNTLLQRLDAATHAASALPEEEEAANAEKLAVLERLGELADWDGAAAMAAALHDGDAAVAAAAEDALWALFMECPTPELQTQMRQGVSLMRRPEQWDQVGGLLVRRARPAEPRCDVGTRWPAAFKGLAPAGRGRFVRGHMHTWDIAQPAGLPSCLRPNLVAQHRLMPPAPRRPHPTPPHHHLPARPSHCLTPWCVRRPPLPRRTTSAARCCT